MEHYLQTYTEPSSGMILTASTSTSSIATTNTTLTNLNTAASNHADQVVLPLTQGCLTTNLGIPIIVVCCKVFLYLYINMTLLSKKKKIE